MKFRKPSFWDYKKPNILSYILLPITFLINFINFLNNKSKIKPQKIKTICIGNIYIGGTGKTPISVKINKIINNLNYKHFINTTKISTTIKGNEPKLKDFFEEYCQKYHKEEIKNLD